MLRVLLVSVAVLALLVGGTGVWVYARLDRNIHAAALFTGTTGTAGVEKADPFGHTPINLLVIGSDARANATDCHLGGGCGSATSTAGSNADVEMLVHVSADRSNATVMSIPRDTVTQIPACNDPAQHLSTPGYYGMINSALTYGPGCQVAAIHQLTGIPIDHFVMVDFSGVVTMSDSIGGVSVCVSDNVYDTYSHLKLAKGNHTLTGVAALEFLRSRHAFGDGGDLGRTYAQHLYLASMIRTLKSAGTLTDPATVYALADAATQAVTVDTGLGSIASLIGLAADVAKVPAARITLTTMQTDPDPTNGNRLVVAPAAHSLFQTIIADQPLTSAAPSSTAPSPTGSSTSSPSPSASTPEASRTAAAPARAMIALQVSNAGTVSGRATALTAALVADGFTRASTAADAPTTLPQTVLAYGPGQLSDAQTVAAVLGLPATALVAGTGHGLVLSIGTDWPSGTVFPGGASSPVDTAQALTGTHVQTADQSGGCAPVSQYRTVEFNHVIMSPGQAYAAATRERIPDSAP